MGGQRNVLIEINEQGRSEEHTSELQTHEHIVCRLLLEKIRICTSSRCSAILLTPLFTVLTQDRTHPAVHRVERRRPPQSGLFLRKEAPPPSAALSHTEPLRR